MNLYTILWNRYHFRVIHLILLRAILFMKKIIFDPRHSKIDTRHTTSKSVNISLADYVTESAFDVKLIKMYILFS